MQEAIQLMEKDESLMTLVNYFLSDLVSTWPGASTQSLKSYFLTRSVLWIFPIRSLNPPSDFRNLYHEAMDVVGGVVYNNTSGDDTTTGTAAVRLKGLLDEFSHVDFDSPLRVSSVHSFSSPSSESMLEWIETDEVDSTPCSPVGHDDIPYPPTIELRIGREAASSLADMFDMMDEDPTFATI